MTKTATRVETPAEVRVMLTPADAQAKGLVPTGHVWDEETQQPVARGMALERSQLDREPDLATHLESYKRNRETLVRFVQNYLQESDYDSRGYPIPGKLRDFYKVPGSDNKALTKRGAEKLAGLFRFGKSSTKVVASTETAVYTSATVEVTLADQYRRAIGSAVSSCSTAEAGFRSVFAQKKYGAETEKVNGNWQVKAGSPADFRAALNDVVARAAKRAFVQALIVATAADEIFVVAEEAGEQGATTTEEKEQEQTKTPQALDAPTGGARLPNAKALKQYAGQLLSALTNEQLSTLGSTLRTKTKNPAVWAPVLEQIDLELDRRTQALLDDDSDDLPF